MHDENSLAEGATHLLAAGQCYRLGFGFRAQEVGISEALVRFECYSEEKICHQVHKKLITVVDERDAADYSLVSEELMAVADFNLEEQFYSIEFQKASRNLLMIARSKKLQINFGAPAYNTRATAIQTEDLAWSICRDTQGNLFELGRGYFGRVNTDGILQARTSFSSGFGARCPRFSGHYPGLRVIPSNCFGAVFSSKDVGGRVVGQT